MASSNGKRAIESALTHGRAILKFISANDVNKTGAHQQGFYLPKSAWRLFSPHPPEKGHLEKSWPKVTWQDGRKTESCVTWYGKGTRSEYRLTRFQQDFPFLNRDSVGSLLVIIPVTLDHFNAFVLDLDEDIEDIQAALNTPVVARFAVFDRERAGEPESENSCIDRLFDEFVSTLDKYPPTKIVSAATRSIIATCIRRFAEKSSDDRLFRWIKQEYRLFQLMERKLTKGDVIRAFSDIDDFLKTASSIMQTRKARAGLSLENHVRELLSQAQIPFEMGINVDGTEPDVLIPSKKSYDDPTYPSDRLFMLALKTTCKDRWRQVLKEAPRIPVKHLLTLQEGISVSQLKEMRDAKVVLVVPKPIQKDYPKDRPMELVEVDQFFHKVQSTLASG